jgi:3-methyladenine DNA glycosylase AlkD/uncharacterized protein YdhG (YjbR/CyaY superfamily)
VPVKNRDVDAYLARLSADKRDTLEKVRRAIRAAAPQAQEGMSYGMPAFIQDKPIAGYAASAKHCAYYPMSGAVTSALEAELEGYETSKGAIRFPIGKPPSPTLIRKLVKARVAEIAAAAPRNVPSVLRELARNASKAFRADMSARYGIVTKDETLGTPMAKIKAVAKTLRKDHDFAEALWRTGVYEARILASMVDEPGRVTPAQMDRWGRDFDNWGVCDTLCFNLFDRSPHAFRQIAKWARAKDEFQKRAAFALLACAALHKRGEEADFLAALPLVERAASDGRHFVKKGVSWALRSIGGTKSSRLRAEARALATQLAASDNPAARWIGRDALREFARKA